MSTSPDELLRNVEDLFKEKKFQEIIDLLTDDLSQSLNHANVYAWAARAYNAIDKKQEALSYLKAKQNFIDECNYVKCEWKRDSSSGEITVTYVDDSSKKHVVWIEDPISVKLKQDYLKKRGITSFSFWSYSYF